MYARTLHSADRPDPAGAADPRGPGQEGGSDADARALLQQLADELRHAALAVVWRQWRALGAAAVVRAATRPGSHAEPRIGRALVDPEALVLVSLVLLPAERRLGDLLHDWGARNSDLLSVQRMKNLHANYPAPVRGPLGERLAWFAAVARDAGKDLRWRSLAEEAPAIPSGRASALARRAGPATVRATRVRLATGAALLLRLRLGLGVGVKADLLAFLLARVEAWATVRDVAEAIGYTVAAVRRAAEDLAAARLIESLEGPPARYRARAAAWAPLLGFEDGAPSWASWHERFVFVAALLHWADAAREQPLSAYAFGAQGRELLARHRAAFGRDEVAVWSEHTPIPDGRAFVERSVRALASWMMERA